MIHFGGCKITQEHPKPLPEKDNNTPLHRIITIIFYIVSWKWQKIKGSKKLFNSFLSKRSVFVQTPPSFSFRNFFDIFTSTCRDEIENWKISWHLKLTFFPRPIIFLTSGDYKHVKYSQNWSRKIHKKFPKKIAICSTLHHLIMSFILTMKILNQIHSSQHMFFSIST